jgi:hypothetical protein
MRKHTFVHRNVPHEILNGKHAWGAGGTRGLSSRLSLAGTPECMQMRQHQNMRKCAGMRMATVAHHGKPKLVPIGTYWYLRTYNCTHMFRTSWLTDNLSWSSPTPACGSPRVSMSNKFNDCKSVMGVHHA